MFSPWKVTLNPDHEVVVNDRMLVIGLDYLYREAMKQFEAGKLLPCAESVAKRLGVQPAEVPIEGYYTESPALKTYFKTMRALQNAHESQGTIVRDLHEFKFIIHVLESGLFGEPVYEGKLIPVGRDPLSKALQQNAGIAWNIPVLVESAYQFAARSNDFSLVGLAARTHDPVVLTALRESVVLYAELGHFGMTEEPEYRYLWRVSRGMAEAVNTFIRKFNKITGHQLPFAVEENAVFFAKAFSDNEIIGRCVRIGDSGAGNPPYYHWAIYITDWRDPNTLHVEDFWHQEVITTEKYRSLNPRKGPAQARLYAG